MTSNPPASCCYKGVRHEGIAVGRYEKYDDLEVYISEPKNATGKGILIITDVLGHKFINAQLIADQFAENGYFVMMPDLFDNDPVPLNQPGDFDIMAWLNGATHKNKVAHLPPAVDPVIELCVLKMRTQYGCERVGTVGYCFGAKYVVRFLDNVKTNAGYMAHPSFVEKEELEAIKAPLAIAAAQDDFMFPPDKRAQSEEILGKLKEVTSQINLYMGTTHGFAVRCDMNVQREKNAKEAAFYQALQWFATHL